MAIRPFTPCLFFLLFFFPRESFFLLLSSISAFDGTRSFSHQTLIRVGLLDSEGSEMVDPSFPVAQVPVLDGGRVSTEVATISSVKWQSLASFDGQIGCYPTQFSFLFKMVPFVFEKSSQITDTDFRAIKNFASRFKINEALF